MRGRRWFDKKKYIVKKVADSGSMRGRRFDKGKKYCKDGCRRQCGADYDLLRKNIVKTVVADVNAEQTMIC